MRTQLLRIYTLSFLLCSLFLCAKGQEYTDNATYYYNNFEQSTAGSLTSLGATAKGNANRVSTSTTLDASTTSPLEGSVSLASTTTTNAIGSIRWNFVGSGANNINLNNQDWEWDFIYKYNGSTALNDPDGMTASSGNCWRYWLVTNNETYDNNNMEGFYVTQVGNTFYLRFRYDNSGITGHYNQILNYTVPANGTAYIIKVQRLNGGSWAVYADPYVAGMTTAQTLQMQATGTTGNGFNIYCYSYLQTVSTAANTFQFDKLDMYDRQLTFAGANSVPVNNITAAPYYAGETVILYGMQLLTRGNYDINSFIYFNVNTPTNGQFNGYFSSVSLYRSSSAFFSTTNGTATLVSNNVTLSSSGTAAIQMTSVNNIVASSGNTDGSLSNPCYYFLVATTRNPLNYSTYNPITDTFTITGVSTIEQYNNTSEVVNYSNSSTTSNNIFFGAYWDWYGQSSNAWNASSGQTNWRENGNPITGSYPSASTDYVRIGYVSYYNTSNPPQPQLNSAISIGALEFGPYGSGSGTTAAAVTLDLHGYALTVANKLQFDAAANVYLNNTGSASTLTSSATGTMASTSILNFTSGTAAITINNNGTFTLNSDASGSALINTIPAGSSFGGTGTYNVQRYITGGTAAKRTWRLLTSPVYNSTGFFNIVSNLKQNLIVTGPGGNASGFDPPASWGVTYTANGATVLTYNGSKFVNVTSSQTASVGTGFYFYYRGDRLNNLFDKITAVNGGYAVPESTYALWSGNLNQGTISVATSGASKFAIVGNPYPCTINVGTTAFTGTNIASTSGIVTTWIYDPNANSTNSTVAAGTTYIGGGEGFLVKTSTGSSGTVVFTEAMKDVASAHQPGNNSLPLLLDAFKPVQDPYIRLKMIQDSSHSDLSLLRFNSKYNANYDPAEDIEDISGNGQTVYFGCMTADNYEVDVNSLPLAPTTTSAFLYVNGSASGIYTLQRVNLSGIPDYYDVWLMDHFKNDSLDMRANSTYNFNIDFSNPASYGGKRFEVVVRLKALPPYKLVAFTGQKSATGNQLSWKTLNEYQYITFNVQRSTDNGATYSTLATIQADSLGQYSYFDQSPPSGKLMYRLAQSDLYQKVSYSNIVIISSAAGSLATFSIYPNPAASSVQISIAAAVSSSVKINIFDTLGNLVGTNTFTGNNTQQDVSRLNKGIYTLQAISISDNKILGTAKLIKL